MKLLNTKCHFMLFGNNSPAISVNVSTSNIEQSDKEKLLGVTLDKNLDFNCHVEEICKKTGQNFTLLHELKKSWTKEGY